MMERSRNRRSRLRLHAILTTLLVVILAFAVTLLANRLETRFAGILDLSPNQQTSLCEETLNALAQLDEDITLHLLYRSETSDEDRTRMETLASRYAAACAHIRYDTIDPVAEPGRVNRYRGSSGEVLSEGSIIVTNRDESRVRILSASDMYSYDYDYENRTYRITSFNGERLITSAVLYITSEETVTVYVLEGHGEISTGYFSTLSDRLALENIEVKPFALLQDSIAPTNRDAVLIASPTIDLTDEEYRELQSFIAAGGRICYLNDPAVDMQALPRFTALLAECGLRFQEGYVLENPSDSHRYLSNNTYIVPGINYDNDLSEALPGNCRLVLPQARAVSFDQGQEGWTYDALLETSDSAFRRSVLSDRAITESDESDVPGRQCLAVAAQNTATGAHLLLIGNLYLAVDTGYLTSTHNLTWMLAAFDWLLPENNRIDIPTRTVSDNALMIPNEGTLFLLALLVLFVMPAIPAVLGLITWLKRRRL